MREKQALDYIINALSRSYKKSTRESFQKAFCGLRVASNAGIDVRRFIESVDILIESYNESIQMEDAKSLIAAKKKFKFFIKFIKDVKHSLNDDDSPRVQIMENLLARQSEDLRLQLTQRLPVLISLFSPDSRNNKKTAADRNLILLHGLANYFSRNLQKNIERIKSLTELQEELRKELKKGLEETRELQKIRELRKALEKGLYETRLFQYTAQKIWAEISQGNEQQHRSSASDEYEYADADADGPEQEPAAASARPDSPYDEKQDGSQSPLLATTKAKKPVSFWDKSNPAHQEALKQQAEQAEQAEQAKLAKLAKLAAYNEKWGFSQNGSAPRTMSI
jgi:hypothetical protein